MVNRIISVKLKKIDNLIVYYNLCSNFKTEIVELITIAVAMKLNDPWFIAKKKKGEIILPMEHRVME